MHYWHYVKIPEQTSQILTRVLNTLQTYAWWYFIIDLRSYVLCFMYVTMYVSTGQLLYHNVWLISWHVLMWWHVPVCGDNMTCTCHDTDSQSDRHCNKDVSPCQPLASARWSMWTVDTIIKSSLPTLWPLYPMYVTPHPALASNWFEDQDSFSWTERLLEQRHDFVSYQE